jgi:hypothetical protein
MKIISLKSISVDEKSSQIIIENKTFDLKEVDVKYSESKLFSYLEINADAEKFIIKGLKSVWEHLRLSTYDVIEKREDNKVYNFYCYFKDISYTNKRSI